MTDQAPFLFAQQPLERQTLFERIAAVIEEQVLSGQLKAGAKLPPEAELAAQFGVSRPVVREALARLRERGLIETTSGSGTVIRHPDARHLAEAALRHLRLSATSGSAIVNLYEARSAIEVVTAQLAAIRATAAERSDIYGYLEVMRSKRTSRPEWTAADLGFHLAIAAASHNPFLLTLLEPLAMVIEGGIQQSHRDPAAVKAGLEAHGQIWTAIEARDEEAASAAMRQHLLDSRDRLMATLDWDGGSPISQEKKEAPTAGANRPGVSN